MDGMATWDLQLLLPQKKVEPVQIFEKSVGSMVPSLIRAAGTTTDKECLSQDGDAASILYPVRYRDEPVDSMVMICNDFI
jgi:hypothetical protein